MLKKIIAIAILVVFVAISTASADQCINCHKAVTPGIVADYERSKMAENGVTCLDCHGEIEGHKDPSVKEHNGFRITPVPSPKYCERCHPQQVQEFLNSKHAWTALIGPFKPWYNKMVEEGKIKAGEAPSEDVMKENDPYKDIASRVTPLYPASGIMDKIGLLEEMKGYGSILYCMECHGTAVIVDENGNIVKGWPNSGIGRLNPDGTPGSCTACHTRHKFSIEEARSPETCGQCHLGPDHPQMEIYEESKHGNIFFSFENKSFLKAEKLTPENTPAPTCAVCHMSEFNGVKSTHDVGERLYWELQPKISTAQWYPSNLVPTGEAKPDEEKAKENRERMKQVCRGCHSPRWVDNYFTEFDAVVEDYNKIARSAKALLDKIYEEGLANKSNPIDEYPELSWYYIWHHDGRRWRMGAAMQGPDYAHWHGLFEAVGDKYLKLLNWYETAKRIKSLETQIGKEETKRSPFIGLPLLIAAIVIALTLKIKMRK